MVVVVGLVVDGFAVANPAPFMYAGIVVHVQDTMATIESDSYETSQPTKIIRKNPVYGLGTTEEERVSREHIAFDGPQIGDLVKQV